MKQLSLFLVLILATSFAHTDQKPKELLKDVNVNKTERLEDYNAAYLKEVLYFASRHRIVKADEKLLAKNEEIAITPFPDVKSLIYSVDNLAEKQDSNYWKGVLQLPQELQKEADEQGFQFTTRIYFDSWDIDKNGNALISSQHQFKHSRNWTFNEEGQAILSDKDGGLVIAGPPPTTPEDIAWHKKIAKLEKHAFSSARAIFQDIDGTKYVLKPLKFTPKYSVLYELDPNKMFPIEDDTGRLDREIQNISEQKRMEEYEAMIAALPKEENKAIKGDIE